MIQNSGHCAMLNEAILFLSALRKAEMNNMINHDHVLVISPETEHHEKINATMNKCDVCCISTSAQLFLTVF